jgi:Bacterial TSP3 repeat
MKRIIVLVALCIATTASAQSFPSDSSWKPLYCGELVMTDRFEDEAGAREARDLVGSVSAPAVMAASDANFLYMRMRLDDDAQPMPGGLAAASWGFAINLDTDLRNYELLLLVDGIAGANNVVVWRNTMTVTPNDPTDPAEDSIATFPITTHANTRVAAGSQFGGALDYWIELAVPWATLMPLGFNRTTPIRVWAASSTAANALDGDFACHDGSAGEPSLDVIISDPTVGDPDVDTDGDGFTDAEEVAAGSDPNDPDSVPASRLEGGGGCSTSGGAGLALGLLALVNRASSRYRRRRRVPSTRTRAKPISSPDSLIDRTMEGDDAATSRVDGRTVRR